MSWSAGIAGFQGGFNAVAQYKLGKFRAAVARYQAQVRHQQAQYEKNLKHREAVMTEALLPELVRATAVQERRIGENTRATANEATTAQAASGFTLSSGNARAVIDDIYRAGANDQREVLRAADNSRLAIVQRARNLREAGDIAEFYGRPTGFEGDLEEYAGKVGAISSLVGAGSDVYSSYKSSSGA